MRRGLILAVAAILAVVAFIVVRDVLRGYWTTRGARIVHFTIKSPPAHRELHEIVVIPHGGGRGRELLVFLHGRSSSPSSNLTQQLFDALHNLRSRAPDVLLADGGDHSYWHDRSDGAWGTALVREAIPAALQKTGADRRRVAIGGISMGGFGALDTARLHPGMFCAVGAHSAALWFKGADTPAGAFDDAEDFAHHDLLRLAASRRLYRVPVWIDVGREDPFYTADLALAHELRAHGTHVLLHVHGGGHSGWAGRMGEYLRYYATACP